MKYKCQEFYFLAEKQAYDLVCTVNNPEAEVVETLSSQAGYLVLASSICLQLLTKFYSFINDFWPACIAS